MSASPIKDRQPNEIDNCTFVKTVLMLLVVIYHSCLFTSQGWFPVDNEDSIILSVLSDWLNSFHIYTFTFVSGYIFSYIRNEKKGYGNYKEFVIKKIKRLVVPAISISLLWAGPIAFIFFHYDAQGLINRYILGVAPNQLWFLWMLFWVFNICYLSIERLPLWASGILSIVLYLVGNFGGHFIPNYFQFWTGCQYTIFFWLGYILRKQKIGTAYLSINPLVWLALDVVLFWGWRCLNESDSASKVIIFSLNFCLNVTGALMAFSILQSIAGIIKWWNNRYFGFLSKRTMTVFLLHQQVIFVAIYLFHGRGSIIMQFCFYILCSILVPIVLSVVLFKFKSTRFLIGEK